MANAQHTCTNISERTAIDNRGEVQRVYRCTFRTAKGATGSVDVPMTATPAEMRDAWTREANKLDQVMS